MSSGSVINTAQNVVSGSVSVNATWKEDVALVQNEAPLAGVDSFIWEFTFRKCRGDTPSLTLSTVDATLTVLEDTNVTLLQIRVSPAKLSAMCGDYIADLKATDTGTLTDNAPTVTHYAHGIVTFVGDPAR